MAAKEDRPAAQRDLFASLLSEGKAVTDLRPHSSIMRHQGA